MDAFRTTSTATEPVGAAAPASTPAQESSAAARVEHGVRLASLDVLRGLAILLVLVSHSPGERGGSGALRPLDAFLHRFGWSGVDLFFVLSGYLVGGLLFAELRRTGRVDVGRFMLRRMLRLWPAYYAFLAFAVVRLTLEGQPLGDVLRQFWPAFTHIQNYIETPRDQLWSLAVEEHFYLVLPICMSLLGARAALGGDGALLPKLTALVCITCLALRAGVMLSGGSNVRFPTQFSVDAPFFGVFIAYLSERDHPVLARIAAAPARALAAAAVACLPAVAGSTFVRHTIGVSLIYVAYGVVIVVVLNSARFARFCRSAAGRALALVGLGSYSIYLWHRDTSWWAYTMAHDLAARAGLPTELRWISHTGAYVLACVLGGLAARALIEAPSLRLRERVLPLSARAPALRSPSR